jgi:hypothetical protein
MQIDFHHAVTYVLARLAGFAHRQADVIAYSAQYVDDATNSGTIYFDNGAMYTRISSAHKSLDYRNFSDLENHHVWIPFHFLPGNSGKAAGDNPNGTFIEKIDCCPGSRVAMDVVQACINDRHRPYGLHRLGISMHVFADTWAHQGFAGVCHETNDVTLLDEKGEPDATFEARLKDFFGDLRDRVANHFVGDVLPLGHGAALGNPDKPFLKWRYKEIDGTIVERDNTDIFANAVQQMCMAMQQFMAGDMNANVPGIPAQAFQKIVDVMATTVDDDGEKRHRAWLNLIAQGYFGFAPIKLSYKAKGEGSWKHQALGTTRKKELKRDEVFSYSPDFLTSDWKMFHDALMAHRFSVIHDILPRYGICAA